MSVGSVHPSPVQGEPACGFGAPARPASAPCEGRSLATIGGEGRAVEGVAGMGRLARWVVGGGATAVARGSIVPPAGGIGGATTGAGGMIEGAGAEGTAVGAAVTTGGAETAGLDTSTVGGGTDRVVRPVMTSIVIAPPATTRQPAIATGLNHRNSAQGRWALARRRRSSQGSVSASSGIAVAGLGTSTSAAPAATRGGAASAPIRSRRERSSSTVRIWSASGSLTTLYNEALKRFGTGFAYFFQTGPRGTTPRVTHPWTRLPAMPAVSPSGRTGAPDLRRDRGYRVAGQAHRTGARHHDAVGTLGVMRRHERDAEPRQ